MVEDIMVENFNFLFLLYIRANNLSIIKLLFQVGNDARITALKKIINFNRLINLINIK